MPERTLARPQNLITKALAAKSIHCTLSISRLRSSLNSTSSTTKSS